MYENQLQRKDVKRFWAKVRKTKNCWLWIASLTVHGGYGQLFWRGKLLRAHRISYYLANGSIDDDLLVCHKCNISKCVRPDHLYQGTDADNWDDCQKSGNAFRFEIKKGEDVYCSKISEKDAKWIIKKDRWVFGEKAETARRLGISKSALHLILSGRNWKHLR